MAEPVIPLLRIRVVKRHDAGDAEITSDLPHLHQTGITSVAMQPGNPGSSALGSFTTPLHPPGSEGYAAAKPIYDQLTRYQRLEFYVSHDGASLGKLAFAGVITGIRKTYGPNAVYELTGASDLQLANMSRPFPGELLSGDVTSAMVKSYLGQNELGFSDTFNPFTSANYTAGSIPGGLGATWTGTTDDGLNVVSATGAGNGALLVSKSGAAANDRWHTHFVECQGRLEPSPDATNGGQCGVVLQKDANNFVLGYVQSYNANAAGRQVLTCVINVYIGGALSTQRVTTAALNNVDDPQGFVPLTIGLLCTMAGQVAATASAALVVNGKVVAFHNSTGLDFGTGTCLPGLMYGNAASGTVHAFLTNLIQMTRFTTDGSSTAAMFGNGTISTSTVGLIYGTDPGPTFLEAWTRLATRTGWYWRYTPQPYVIGTRTLGTVDFAADPGADLTNKVIFRRDQGNLVSLEFNNNGDALAADTALTGQSTPDGGGISYWRDIATLGTYGVIQDEALSFTHSDFNSLHRAARHINANKIALDTLGAKTAVVLRDPQYADTYRELDKITVHDPEMGLNYQSCRIMARTFTEGQPNETLMLDQFSEDFIT